MIIKTLQSLFKRDLDKLITEIESYHNEKKLWVVEKNISNSAGNLTLHLIGNLNAYIGAEIGKTGYVRNRPLEFSLKEISRNELIARITATMKVVEGSLDKLTADQLEAEYPVMVFAEKMTTGFFLIHLATHLSYHLGQINYHRRLLEE